MSGLFSSLKKEVNSAASSISKELGTAAKKVEQKWDEHAKSPLLDNFRTNNVIQLISRSSGRSLQIVTSMHGQLVVDGLGPEGMNCYNAHWTVINEGRNIVRIHNNNNYLAIVNGTTAVVNYPQPHLAGPETRFRLHQNQQFISLESDKEMKSHVGVINNGQLKPALACGREIDGQWGVRVIYTPYQTGYPPQQAQGTTHVVTAQGTTTYVQPGVTVHTTQIKK